MNTKQITRAASINRRGVKKQFPVSFLSVLAQFGNHSYSWLRPNDTSTGLVVCHGIGKIPQLIAICGLILLALNQPLRGDTMKVIPPTGNDPQGNPLLQPHADCNGVTPGGTDLLNGGTLKVLDVTPQNWLNIWQPIWNDVKNQFSNNWTTWQGGASLGGSLYIDAYQAFDMNDATYCTHWAELLAHYENITVPAGEKVEWVQVYRKSGAAQDPPGYGNQSGWSFDPPANVKFPSGKTSDNAPFYYNKDEKHYDPQPGIPDEQVFWDKSQQNHAEKNIWNGDMEFDLFLVSWDGSYDEKPHTLTVHDGFAWGFNGYCTPEPSSLILLGIGLVGLIGYGWKARR